SADHEILGAYALFNKLRKDKVLSRNAQFQAVMEAGRSTLLHTGSTLTSPLEIRLLSSRALSSEVSSLVSSLRSIVSPPLEPRADDASGMPDERPAKAQKASRDHVKAPTTASAISVGGDGASMDDSQQDGGDIKGEDGLYGADDITVANDDWESGTVEDESDDGQGDSYSDAPIEPELPGPSHDATKLSRGSSAPSTDPRATKPSESIFLPSLAVGFTRGDSDSEFSDREAAAADGVRKNRRGQRARRAIWEKKYGRNAKHLKKDARSSEHDTKFGQSYPRGKPHQPQQQDSGPHDSRPGVSRLQSKLRRSTLSASEPLHLPMKDSLRDDKPLHPSWEAKKKLKEQQSASIRPPMGTRITFDD
ncbi:Bud-site selection protein, partial [Vararia minispora EC-137]